MTTIANRIRSLIEKHPEITAGMHVENAATSSPEVIEKYTAAIIEDPVGFKAKGLSEEEIETLALLYSYISLLDAAFETMSNPTEMLKLLASLTEEE